MKATTAKSRLSWLNILYFVLGMAVLIFLLRKIDFNGLIRLVVSVNPLYLLLGGVIYLCKALVRSMRLVSVNQRSRPRLMDMLRLTLAYSLAGQILPLKLGELSYIYLLKKDQRSSIPQGVSSLVVVRIFDLLAIALLFVLISLLVRLPQNLSVYFYSVLAFVGVLLVIIVLMLALARFASPILNFIFGLRLVQKLPFAPKIRGAAQSIFDELIQYRPGQYALWGGLALVEWLVNYASFHVLLLGIGMTPTFFDTVVCVTFAALASVLPINSFGNFGTQEAGWATGLVLLGYPQEIAITSGFATHLLTLGYMLLLGGLSWISYLVKGRAGER